MSVAAWIAVGVVGWIAVGLVVAVLVGRMVRQRDRQVPEDDRVPRPASPAESDPQWPRETPRTPQPRRPRT